MKKLLSLLLLAVLLLSVAASLTGCSAPKVEEIYDRVVYLVEASHEINTIFYGPGMPVYREDSAYAQLYHIYYDFPQSGFYEIVISAASKYPSEDLVLRAAKKVYSKAFLEDVLLVSAFTGFVTDSGTGDVLIARARYLDENGFFCMSADPSEVRYTSMRIYDYSTMEVHSLGRRDACTVTMDSWLEDSPDKIETVELKLVLQDGQWFLDSFTGA